jgi:hypothetical protein
VAFAVLCLLVTGLSALPAIFSDSGVESFRTLQGIFSELNGMLLFLAGAIGLFVISSHFRSRCLKMVFTKPCPPSMWLGSAFLSAVLISLFLNSLILGGTVILSLIWHVPVRTALIFISADNFIISVGIIAYLILLATVLHPALAVAFILIFNAEMFYNFQVWAQGAIRAGNSSLYLRVFEKFFHFLYLLLPMVNPYGKKMEDVHSSLRVAHAETSSIRLAMSSHFPPFATFYPSWRCRGNGTSRIPRRLETDTRIAVASRDCHHPIG